MRTECVRATTASRHKAWKQAARAAEAVRALRMSWSYNSLGTGFQVDSGSALLFVVVHSWSPTVPKAGLLQVCDVVLPVLSVNSAWCVSTHRSIHGPQLARQNMFYFPTSIMKVSSVDCQAYQHSLPLLYLNKLNSHDCLMVVVTWHENRTHKPASSPRASWRSWAAKHTRRIGQEQCTNKTKVRAMQMPNRSCAGSACRCISRLVTLRVVGSSRFQIKFMFTISIRLWYDFWNPSGYGFLWFSFFYDLVMFCFHMVCEFLCYELHDLDTFWIQLGYDSDGILIRFRYVSSLPQDWFWHVSAMFLVWFPDVLLSEPCFSTWQKP